MRLPERGLIIRQPWIELILSGKKTWEMRSKPTAVRGRIALIEAGTGLIVGETELTSSPKHLTLGHVAHEYKWHRVNDYALLEQWPFPWVLQDTERYEQPVPYNHPKGAVIWVDLTKPGVLP